MSADPHYLWSHPDHTPRIAKRSETSFAAGDPLWVAKYPVEVWAAPGGQEPAWWTFKSITGGDVFYEGPARPEGAPARAIPLYAGPIAGVKVPLTEERLLQLRDTHVGEPTARHPITDADWINFARAVEFWQGIVATAPASQKKP